MLLCFISTFFACQDPEASANNATDSAGKNPSEGTILNSPPGGTSTDTSRGTMADTSHADSMH